MGLISAMNKIDLETLVELRIRDAEVLLLGNCYAGAYYLAGYALECAIKACVAMQVKENDFPDKQLANASHTHRLTDLIGVAGLKQKLNQRAASDEMFYLHWTIVKDWSETARYDRSVGRAKAEDMYHAMTNSESGVLPWLKTYW